MYTYRQAAASACLLFALTGCAHHTVMQPLDNSVATAIQPVDVKIGVVHPELFAQFERSKGAAAAAASCGAIPGIGVLLAGVCGGTAGAIDASVNAGRAKTADDIVRPLKDEIVDLNFNQIVTDSLKTSLQTVPGMQTASVIVTNTVNDDAYEEVYRASTANGVMFVNVDYYITTDFSALEMRANSHIFPRSPGARTAAKLSPELEPKVVDTSKPASAQTKLLDNSNSSYRSVIFYNVKLPLKADTSAEYIAAWKADGARKLRAGIADGTAQISRLLAEDLQRRVGGTDRPALSKVDIGNRVMADVIAQNDNGKLMRYPDGTLHYQAEKSILGSLPAQPDTAVVALEVAPVAMLIPAQPVTATVGAGK